MPTQVRISCAGYPSRREFEEFVDHFWNLAPELLSLTDDRQIVTKLLAKVDLPGHQLGKTKVFLKSGQMAILDKKRTEVMGAAATTINKMVRGFLAKRSYQRTRAATVTLQVRPAVLPHRPTILPVPYGVRKGRANQRCAEDLSSHATSAWHPQFPLPAASDFRVWTTTFQVSC